MFENLVLSILSGVLLAMPAYYVMKRMLLRRLFLRRNLRCIVPYEVRGAERLPDRRN